MSEAVKVLKNTVTGQEIHLVETNNIKKLECQLMMLGMNGLAYTKLWNDIAKRIKELKREKELQP